MGLRWPMLLGCLFMVMTAHSAVVPTQDTLVISKTDDVPSEASNDSTPASAAELTTEGPLPPVKLLEMHVKSEVALRYSRTVVTTLVKNPARRGQETTFRVLLPETAFISGFSMTIEGKRYDAYVKEKEEAKQIYNDAVSQGLGAAHVSAKARDSNHFTVSVNIERNSTAFFNLTYEELLTRRNGVYNHAINLYPGSLVANLTVEVHLNEAQKITTLRVPEVTTGNEIAPTDKDAQNTKAVIIRSQNQREATIVFKPDLEEQKRLMEIYAQKTKESLTNKPSWYYSDKEAEDSTEGVLGQFVIQYDVDRTSGNEVLVNDGYFAHFFAPSDLPPLEKHVVFVLDTSGSMMDRKIQQLREAMQIILGELHPGDYFSIVEFASSVTVHDLKEADKPVEKKTNYYYWEDNQSKPTILVPPYPATPENIAKAKIIVSRLEANGGTNIAGALDVATDLVHRGTGWKQVLTKEPKAESASTSNTSSTESIPSSTTSTELEKIEVNKDDKNLEPMIIFLTDGEPTIGESDPKRIVSRLREKNYGDRKAAIFSLAFGEDADRKFLRTLSLRNDGFMRHIYEAADAALQLRDFYQQVTSPLLSHVNFTYPPDQVKENSLTKIKFRTYYAGSEVVVAGKIEPAASEIYPEVYGYCGVDDGFARKRWELHPKVIVPKEEKRNDYLPLERLWAYLTIKQLLDERDAAEDLDEPKKEKTEIEKKALELALKYSFVTELTSLVVVKPNATSSVNAESVDKNETPSYGAVPLSAQYSGFTSGAGAGGVAAYSLSSVARPSAFFAPVLLSNVAHIQSSADSIPNYEAEEDVAALDYGGFITSTMPPFTTEDATEPPAPLAAYHLEQYPWVQPLLNATVDELVIHVNGTDIHLKLAKDDISQTTSDVECGHATDGASGVCVYLPRCNAARDISAELYTSTFCLIDNQFAGVCCPKTNSNSDDTSTLPAPTVK